VAQWLRCCATNRKDAVSINDPTKPTARSDVTRPNGLPETIQIEDVSVAEQA